MAKLKNDMDDAKRNSHGSGDYFKNLCAVCCASCACTVFFAIVIIIPVCMVVIGAVYFDKKHCPYEKHIALLLILGGLVAIVGGILSFFVRSKPNERVSCGKLTLIIFCGLLNLAAFCIFIATCVLVFRIYSTVSFSQGSGNYCHEVLYMFAFVILIIIFTLILLIIFIFCILLCCFACS